MARHVASRTIDLGRIFAAECATAVTSHAAIGIDDDLAASQSGVAHGAADDEASGRIDVVLGVLVQHFGGKRSLNHELENVAAQFVVADRLGVLGGDDDRIDADRLVVLVVLHGDLGLAVGPEVGKGATLADFRKALAQLVRQENGSRHVVGIFVAGVAEHHALIAGAAGIDAHGDVARLLVDAGDDRAGVGVKAVERVVITDGGDHAPHQRLEIDVSFGGNFAGDDDQAGCREGFASHAAIGIFFQAGIQDRVRNLIGDLVRVTFGHRFGRKQIAMVGQIQNSFYSPPRRTTRNTSADTTMPRSNGT